MSRRFIESFFPSTTALLRQFAPQVVQHYFPDDLDDRCPEVVVSINSAVMSTTTTTTTIRNPILAVWIVLGIGVGLYGATMAPSTTTSRSWKWAFGAFGAMNAVALPLHCIFPRHEHSTTAYPIVWMLDCVMTGLSSLYLIQGALDLVMEMSRRTKFQQRQKQHAPTWMRRQFRFVIHVIVPWWHRRIMRIGYSVLVSAMSMSHFVEISVVQLLAGPDNENPYNIPNNSSSLASSWWWKEPLWVEWTYLGPLIWAMGICPFAVVMGSWWTYNRTTTTTSINLIGSIGVMVMGVVLGGLGVLRVNWFCDNFSTNQWWDAFSAPTLVFAGCDVAFVGLGWWWSILRNKLDAADRESKIA
eukprot:scaffold6030_cov199-Amphora_coffeaeformis.AAC.4